MPTLTCRLSSDQSFLENGAEVYWQQRGLHSAPGGGLVAAAMLVAKDDFSMRRSF
jgi:hypothetical protein